MKPVLVSLALALCGQAPADPGQKARPVRLSHSFDDRASNPTDRPRNFRLGPGAAADPKDGTLRLAHSVLLADETGATDYRQTEDLKGKVLAKKVFVLDRPEVSSAELLFFGQARQVLVNGQAASTPQPLGSSGWTRVVVPPALLKKGANEFRLQEGQLLLEPGRPGRSFRSADGGRTWSRRLGGDGTQQGEYLVRLRLGRYAPRGEIRSHVIDLWAGPPGDVPAPGRVVGVRPPAIAGSQPAGTTLMAWLRTGDRPRPCQDGWTGWIALDKDYRPEGLAGRHRWAQLKLELATTDPQATPRVASRFSLDWDFLPDRVPRDRLRVLADNQGGEALPGSTPFVYQAPSPRLQLLRDRYGLERVVAPGKTEMEKLMLLRWWVRNQWHTAWGSHPAAWMPPWDALVILESRDQPDCLTMCTHYAAVFTQCCQALGWDARHCILDHHCVSEVYVRGHDRWVMMDTGNSAERADVGLHFERAGLPLSARELHLARRDGRTAGITVHFTPAALARQIAPLCRPAPKPPAGVRPDVISLADLDKYPVCGLDNYRRYAFPARNTFLTSRLPGELEQGWSNYFYDGYYWVGDGTDDPRLAPEYSRHLDPTRPQDVDWKLGWTRIHLSRTARPGELHVDLETNTPNLAHFERLGPGDKRQPTPAHFVWRLRPGRNELAVQSVNRWARVGRPARLALDYQSARAK